jgi:hypothetical protein
MSKQPVLFVATPMYGGQCYSHFTTSLLQLGILATQKNLAFQFFSLSNESLIPRARNVCVQAFIDSQATHFMFIDADIGFKADHVLEMLDLMLEFPSYKILGGAYAKKTIAWEKVQQAAAAGKGLKNPSELKRFSGDFVVNLSKEPSEEGLQSPWPVEELGSGFLMIERECFSAFAKHYPEKTYLPDNPRSPRFVPGKRIHAFFESGIDPETQHYFSEDYYFCKQMARIGYQSWLCPWIDLVHVGTYPFESHLSDMLELGLNLRFKTPKPN